MKQCLICTFVCAFSIFGVHLHAQNLWQELSGRSLPAESPFIALDEEHVRQLSLDAHALELALSHVPLETDAAAEKALLPLPSPDGSYYTFDIREYHVFADGPVAGIRTFHGRALEDPLVRVRLDLSVHGLRAMISTPDDVAYIEPAQLGAPDGQYLSFSRKGQGHARQGLDCGFSPELPLPNVKASSAAASAERTIAGDCTFRSYRLAIATTGEYSNYFGATSPAQSALVLAAVVNTVNRVNSVFENDMGVRLLLLNNTANTFFYNSGTDPYSDGNAGAMLSQNIATCNSTYTTAGYDIGHVFGAVGGNGVANFGVCNNSLKAGGVTLRSAPVGDPFDIDYVAHEIGHQFHANHTQNNNCNRSGSSYEPGSASTIMGYAGICAPNVQANSDPYFHAISIEEIRTFISTGFGNTCATVIPSSNATPTVNAGADVAVPAGTPLVLTAIGSDPNPSDVLTYQWEHYDNGVASMPPQPSNTQGPNFRSLTATANPARFFPNLDAVRNGVTPTWEVLPAVNRSSTFRVTARDNATGGCTAEDDLTLTWVDTGQPFAVLQPSGSATVWGAGMPNDVQWLVAGTATPPISCSNVEILLSTDGGLTYPTVLAAAAPNTGSATVTIPPGTPNTTSARVLVRSLGNVFYNISAQDFEIGIPPPPLSCSTVSATDLPQDIGPNANTVTTSTLTVVDNFAVQRVSVTNMNGTHTYSSDIDATLISPAGTRVELFTDLCGSSNNFSIGWANSGLPYANVNCPITSAQLYQPKQSLTAFNGESSFGQWQLELIDDANQDGGTFDAWTIEVCFDAAAPLPIELVDFSASAKTSHIELSWQTASEDNNAGFQIERVDNAADVAGQNFRLIAETPAKGSAAVYTHIDREVSAGKTYYYRLTQTDLDGTATSFDIVSAALAEDGSTLGAALSGNSLKLSGPWRGEITVVDAVGKIVATSIASSSPKTISTNDWTSGWYIIHSSQGSVRTFVP